MWRALAFLAVLGLAAWGLAWLADSPGAVTLTWRGVPYPVPPTEAFGLVLALALALSLAISLLRLALRAPALMSLASRARRRERGFKALSRGMIAIGAGDLGEAQRCAREAERYFGDEALTRLLRAQTAQLSGDRAGAVGIFNEMLAREDTHILGLRGLHVEARRAGEPDPALEFARRAYARAAPPWAAQAVLDDYAARGDWVNALATVEANAKGGLIDRPTANRWRAVLKTALAEQRAERDPKAALILAREALDLAPSLVPAAAICGRLTAASGDLRRAARLLETAYRAGPHPDLVDAYVRLRSGDSAADRFARATALARVAPFDPESLMALARGALETQDLATARKTLGPLLQGEGVRPTARVCLLMAEIEEAAGDEGAVREWLSRAARAPRDRAWVAGEVIADRWAPAAPNGALDAFVWRTPDERLAGPPAPITLQPAPAAPAPPAVAVPAASVAARPARRAPGSAPMLVANAPDDPGPHIPQRDEFRDLALE